MPKEYIYPEQTCSNGPDELLHALAGEPPNKRAVKVIWDKMGYVQVATVQRADGPHRASGLPATDDALVDDGQHIELQRADINTLIRTLRRAREQAFGRDE